MATRTIAKSDKWTREQYQEKNFARATSNAPAWAFGCELCEYGRQADGQWCTCRAGQARHHFAAGIVLEDADGGHVPTINAAYQ